jgi:hypothetical protein
MSDASRFVISPGAFYRRVPHPLTNIFELLLMPQHEVSEALASSVEGRMYSKVMANSLVQGSLETATFNLNRRIERGK